MEQEPREICKRCKDATELIRANDRFALLDVACIVGVDLNKLSGKTPSEEWGDLRKQVVSLVGELAAELIDLQEQD